MRHRSKWPPLFILVLFIVACAAALLTPYTGPRGECVASAIGDGRVVPDLVGTWVGTWEDTIYDASGAMNWTITQNGVDVDGSGDIDFSYFGMGVREGGGAGGIVSARAETLEFTFDGDGVGNGIGNVVGNACSGTGTVTSPLEYGGFTFQGTVTNLGAEGRFFFLSPTGGAGRVTMTNTTPVESTTWGTIKAGYRNDEE